MMAVQIAARPKLELFRRVQIADLLLRAWLDLNAAQLAENECFCKISEILRLKVLPEAAGLDLADGMLQAEACAGR